MSHAGGGDRPGESRLGETGGFSTVPEAVAAIRAGELVIVVDDAARENEGDLIGAAAQVTPEMINFMATHGRGLVCVSLPEDRLQALDLPPMVARNTARLQTNFTVSVDAVEGGVCAD